jgi:hypothetical protein
MDLSLRRSLRKGITALPEDLTELLLEIVKAEGPETVDQLVELASKRSEVPRKQVLDAIVELENDGRLKLTPPPREVPEKLGEYLTTSHSAWFWIINACSIATALLVFTVTSTDNPLIYTRYLLGSAFVLVLPGYSLVKTLFPTKEIDSIERTALSIGMSLALVPLVGLLLNYTPWGIRLTPVTLSLLALTTFLTATGIIREHAKKLEVSSD